MFFYFTWQQWLHERASLLLLRTFPVCPVVNIYCFIDDDVWIDVISDKHIRNTWLTLWQCCYRITALFISTWCNRRVHTTCAWNLDTSRTCGWACLFVCVCERGGVYKWLCQLLMSYKESNHNPPRVSSTDNLQSMYL